MLHTYLEQEDADWGYNLSFEHVYLHRKPNTVEVAGEFVEVFICLFSIQYNALKAAFDTLKALHHYGLSQHHQGLFDGNRPMTIWHI